MLLFLMLIADEGQSGKVLWIYENYHDNMLRYARRLLSLCGDRNYMHDGEDVVQGAFVRITGSIDKIDVTLPEKVVGGYVMTIVKNEVADFIKKEKECLSLDDMLTFCEECNYLEEYRDRELYKRIMNEIGKMEPIYRDVMIMKFVDGKSTKEIAEELGVPEKTVYTRISRAVGALKKKFKREVL